jgi:hypothetical protein
MGHDVFISHSSKDKAVSDAACALLERRGFRCWMAPRDILPGQEWGEAIIEGIKGARIFVLIFSSNANFSQQVRREVERAAGHGLPIIPFRIEDVQPARSLEYFISNQHWLDALKPPMERHLDYLGDVVARLQAGPAVAPAAPEPSSPAAPAPGRDGIVSPGRRWLAAAAILLFLAVLGIAAVLLMRGGRSPEENVLVDNQPVLVSENQAAPASPPPPLTPLFNIASAPTETAPEGYIDAMSLLEGAALPIRASVSPVSARLVVISRDWLEYRIEQQTGEFSEMSRTPAKLLVLQAYPGSRAFLTLRFAEPLSEVRLVTPAFAPVENLAGSWMAFPAVTIRAVNEAGAAVAARDLPAWRTDRSRRSRWGTIVLSAPEGQGIVELRLVVDGVISTDINGQMVTIEGRPPPPIPPTAAFIIAQLSGRRLPQSAAPAPAR